MAELIETDVLVVGAGGAGMRAACEASLAGAKVLVAVKGRFGAGPSTPMCAHAEAIVSIMS